MPSTEKEREEREDRGVLLGEEGGESVRLLLGIGEGEQCDV